MNIKKIGLSALAGSLVAFSANAAEMSVAGSASLNIEHTNGGFGNSGKTFSMGNQLTFTGSGEMDNGLNVSLSFVLDQGDDKTTTGAGANTPINANAPFDSHSVTISSDGLGSLTFAGEGGSSATSALDGTAAGETPVLATETFDSPADGAAFVLVTDPADADIIALDAGGLANAANNTTLTGEELFKTMAAAGANNEISGITVSTAGDKFYLVAYDNDDVMIFFADSGADTTVAKTEVNLVAHISGPNIAVGGLEAGDFVLG